MTAAISVNPTCLLKRLTSERLTFYPLVPRLYITDLGGSCKVAMLLVSWLEGVSLLAHR